MKNGLVFSLVLALTGLFTRVLQIAISSFFVCLAIFSYILLSAEILLSEHPVNFRFVYVSGASEYIIIYFPIIFFIATAFTLIYVISGKEKRSMQILRLLTILGYICLYYVGIEMGINREIF